MTDDLIKELEELAAEPPRRRQDECKTCFTLRDASPERRAAVDAALAAGASPSKLAASLAKAGYDLTSENLSRHHSKGHTLS